MANRNKIKSILLNGFIDEDSAEDLTNNTPLISSGIIDSISILQLVDLIEKEFNIEFEAHEIDRDQFDSIDLINGLITAKKDNM